MPERLRFFIMTVFLITQVFCRPLAAADNPFGVLAFLPWNDYWNSYMYADEREVDRAVKLIKELGVSTVRIDFSWKDIERVPGVYELQRLDYIVSACKRYDIAILGVIGYSPEWTGREWNQPPPDSQPLLKFVDFIVRRYPSVVYWEFWNEPDSPTYWYPQDEMRTYTKLLKVVYPVIKAANSKSRVLLGGLTSGGFYALKNVLREGGGDYFDIMNLHPFVDPFRGEEGLREAGHKLKHIGNELAKYDLDKPIWLTEIGCPGVRKVDDCSWWFGFCTNEDQQAEFLRRAYGYLLRQERVDKVFWAFFQDTEDHFHNGVDGFGLLRGDYSQKPSFIAYRDLIREFASGGRKK
jgi:hypothetical protein